MVGFCGAGLGTYVAVKLTANDVKWLKDFMLYLQRDHKEAMERVHGRVDGVETRFTDHLKDHAYGRVK